MNILVISSNYPSNTFPNHGAFVYNLLQEISKSHKVTVISPHKAHHFLKKKQVTYGEERCQVQRPLFLSVGNRKIGGIDLGSVSASFFKAAVGRIVDNLSEKPDIIYAHFLSSAVSVLDYVEKNGIPLVVASGESTYDSWIARPSSIQARLRKLVSHVICVSNENKTQLLALGFDEARMSVIPNAVDYSVFRPLDKKMCKEKIGASSKKFIVGFVGHFIHRKGPDRIIDAIKLTDDESIQLICVGGKKEELTPNKFTKVLAPVPNYQLPELFNAFDVFVLPTLHEGHCNVVEEAKAVGIPIISSRGTSVEEQIDESIGILVDPLNISEIADAISKLKNDTSLYQTMATNLIEKRGENSLRNRSQRIISILSDVLGKNNNS